MNANAKSNSENKENTIDLTNENASNNNENASNTNGTSTPAVVTIK